MEGRMRDALTRIADFLLTAEFEKAAKTVNSLCSDKNDDEHQQPCRKWNEP
jgi:hypothetical protein